MRLWPFGADREKFFAALSQQIAHCLLAVSIGRRDGYVPETLRGLGNRVALDQDILAAKFVLRVAAFGRVAVRLHVVMKIEHLRRLAERGVDFLFRPDVERAFGIFGL